jgi:hypothetical protein
MPHKNGKDGVVATAEWSSESRQRAAEQLAKILDSPQFRSSRRCSVFLRYVVEQAVNNHFDTLKERTVGVSVFDRDPDYDTNQDPVVRSTAGEVRKRLAQYYMEPAHEREFRITLPPGSYVPEVHPPLPENVETAAPVSSAFPAKRFLSLAARIGIAPGIGIALVAALLAFNFRNTDLDRFWSPVLEAQGNILMCLGQPKAYNFNTRKRGELDDWFDGSGENKQPPQAVPVSEIVPMWDSYVAFEDAKASSLISNLFAKNGRAAELRGGRLTSLTSLRGRPVVLIGAFNNDWTMSLAGELRFYFDIDYTKSEATVRDRLHPGAADWKIVNEWPYRKIQVDYAIVSRVRNSTTEQTVVTAAGITHYGTTAAAEFLTNPAYFAEAVKRAPRDWSSKNMQVVLSAKVMSGTAGPPRVMAVHFW